MNVDYPLQLEGYLMNFAPQARPNPDRSPETFSGDLS
jgi:hypothetical protein